MVHWFKDLNLRYYSGVGKYICETLVNMAGALPEIQNGRYYSYIILFSFLHCDVFQWRTIFRSYVPGSQHHHCEKHSAGVGFYSICLFSFQLSHQRTLIRCRAAMIQWQAYHQLEEELLALHTTTLVPLPLSRDPIGTTVKWLTFKTFGFWRAFCVDCWCVAVQGCLPRMVLGQGPWASDCRAIHWKVLVFLHPLPSQRLPPLNRNMSVSNSTQKCSLWGQSTSYPARSK